MRGLLLFLAGCLVGGALIAWLLGESPAPETPAVAVPEAPPLPQVVDAPVTDLDPASLPPPRTAQAPVGDDVEPLRPAVPDLNAPAGDDLDSGDLNAPLPAEAAPVVPSAPPAEEHPATAPAGAVDADAANAIVPPLRQPVGGVAAAALADTYADARGDGRRHDAIDIMAPRGTPVHAVADGHIEKLFASVPGGNTIYQFDNERRLAFYYAHLDRYADGLAEGMTVEQGELIGYVGSTGNANAAAPHLHFAVFVLGPEKHWWEGTAINPYPLLRAAPDAP